MLDDVEQDITVLIVTPRLRWPAPKVKRAVTSSPAPPNTLRLNSAPAADPPIIARRVADNGEAPSTTSAEGPVP